MRARHWHLSGSSTDVSHFCRRVYLKCVSVYFISISRCDSNCERDGRVADRRSAPPGMGRAKPLASFYCLRSKYEKLVCVPRASELRRTTRTVRLRVAGCGRQSQSARRALLLVFIFTVCSFTVQSMDFRVDDLTLEHKSGAKGWC